MQTNPKEQMVSRHSPAKPTINVKEVFTEIYEKKLWSSKESVSGLGSEMKATETIRKEIPQALKKFEIKSMLDIPCGDLNWMSQIDLGDIEYIGADIVDSLIINNQKNYNNKKFQVLNIINDNLPKVDLIFTRDLFGHFSFENINKSLDNIQKSGSKYLLTTSFTKWHYNIDIKDGGWRPINLMIPPFKLKPIYLINENCAEGGTDYNDKCLVLFEIEKLYCGT